MCEIIGKILVSKDPTDLDITADQVREFFDAKSGDLKTVVLSPNTVFYQLLDNKYVDAKMTSYKILVIWDYYTRKIIHVFN